MLIFDVETNGFLEEATRIWCICVIDTETCREWAFSEADTPKALELLSTAATLVAHTGLSFDFAVLKKLAGWSPRPDQKIRDTLVWSRLVYPDRELNDLEDHRPEVQALQGSHSLEAWGVRLDIPKIHTEITFEEYHPEILERCQQDVRVNLAIVKHLQQQPLSEQALELEQYFAWLSERMSERGFCFDATGAEKLAADIELRQSQITEEIQRLIPGRVEEMKTPDHWLMTWPDGSSEQFPTKGEAEKERKARKIKPKECLLARGPNTIRVHGFNPGSRLQVRKYLHETYGWLSPKLTDKGEELLKAGQGTYNELAEDYGQVSEDILRLLDWGIAKQFADYFLLTKTLGQLKTGPNSWLNLVKPDNKIHHRMIPLGTPTSRCCHSSPNLGQVPHVLTTKDAEGNSKILWGYEGRYGADCRNLFRASEGYTLVGVDLSGIEARMLAHFLHPYDKGVFADKVLTGDIHQSNVDAFSRIVGYTIGRNEIKTPFYAFCYACGREKQGVTIVEYCPEAKSEYKTVLDLLGQGAGWQTARQIASAIVWGTDSPRDEDEKKFRWLMKSVMRADNLQEASSLAYSVVGGRAQRAFVEGIVGLDQLLAAVQQQAQRGFLAPLDGRLMPVRKGHAALNTLLQGSAAIVMKRWVVGTAQAARARGIDSHILAIVHDETQAEVSGGRHEEYGELSLGCIKAAGEFYKLNLRLDGEAKYGQTWADTH